MAKRDEDLVREKREALFDAYKKARAKLYMEAETYEDFKKIHSRAIKMAIETPQKRFWLSQYRTYRILGQLVNGGGAERGVKTWKTRSNLHKELLEKYNRLSQKRMFKGMSLWFVSSFVTYEPCSGFFMSYSRAGRAIAYELKKRRESR